MIQSNIKKQFSCERNKLWDIITDNSNYVWRSDLSKIEIIDDTHFVEYTKNNFPTYFTITSKEKLKEYKKKVDQNYLSRFGCRFDEIVSHNNVDLPPSTILRRNWKKILWEASLLILMYTPYKKQKEIPMKR